MNLNIETVPSRISVIMPLYNTANYVGEALASIGAQTRPVDEVIVVDDGSTDGSADIATSFPIATVIRKPHGGIHETLNRALAHVTGNFIAFLDADDRWLPEKIHLQMSDLEANPKLDMVFGHSRRFRSAEIDGRRVDTVLNIVPGLAKTCLLIRRSSFDKVGYNFADSTNHDFLSWYSRATEAALMHSMLPEIVAERRIHSCNFGVVNKASQRQKYFRALKAHLDRCRSSQSEQPTEHRS